MMLETIDKVKWMELHHAYGTCENFPEVVRRLAHPQKGVRNGALSYISENLFHQGTHYPVNEFALPFLLEMAASPEVPDRVPLYRLLQTMLAGESIPMSPRQRKEHQAYLRRAYPWMFDKRGKKKDSDSSHWVALFEKSAAAAWKCRKLLLDVIRSNQAAGVRCEAVRLLAEMARSSHGKPWVKAKDEAKLVEVFRRQAGADSDLAVRASCALALGLLRDEPTAEAAVASVFAKSKTVPVRTAAAAAWSLMASAVPTEALRILLDGILNETLRTADAEEIPSPLPGAYAELGMPLGGSSPRPSPAAALAVPFPPLSLWLNASVREPAGLAKAVAELFAAADPPRKMPLIALVGRLHLKVPALDAFLRSVVSNRRETTAIRLRAAAALKERRAGLPAKRFETLLLTGLRSTDPAVRRSVVDAVADIPTFLTPDGFENINDDANPVEAAWEEFGTRLLPLVVGELGKERDPQVRLAFAGYVQGIHYRWGKEKAGILEAATLLAGWPDEPLIAAAAMKAMDFATPSLGATENAPNLRRFYDRLLQYFHGSIQFRASAARLLLKIHSRQAETIPLLLPLLESDPDDTLRGKLAYALYCQSFQGPKAFPRETIDQVMLRVMRADRSPEVVRWACGWFNARVSSDGGVSTRHSTGGQIRPTASFFTGNESRLLETVLDLFESDARSADGQSLRPYLVDVLSCARSNYPRVLNALIGVALDPSSGLRHAAMDALLIRRTGPEIPSEVCEEAMTRLLDSGDPEVILWSLKRHMLYIGETVRAMRMPELTQHPDPLVAQHAKEILERGW